MSQWTVIGFWALSIMETSIKSAMFYACLLNPFLRMVLAPFHNEFPCGCDHCGGSSIDPQSLRSNIKRLRQKAVRA